MKWPLSVLSIRPSIHLSTYSVQVHCQSGAGNLGHGAGHTLYGMSVHSESHLSAVTIIVKHQGQSDHKNNTFFLKFVAHVSSGPI